MPMMVQLEMSKEKCCMLSMCPSKCEQIDCTQYEKCIFIDSLSVVFGNLCEKNKNTLLLSL